MFKAKRTQAYKFKSLISTKLWLMLRKLISNILDFTNMFLIIKRPVNLKELHSNKRKQKLLLLLEMHLWFQMVDQKTKHLAWLKEAEQAKTNQYLVSNLWIIKVMLKLNKVMKKSWKVIKRKNTMRKKWTKMNKKWKMIRMWNQIKAYTM